MGFEQNGMVYISQSSIEGQLFHWHDELELLIVVEGSIELKVGYEWLYLKRGDIMLINSDEIHSIKETDEKNKIVCVYMDCNVCYEKFSDFYEIVAIWTYKEAYEKLNQNRKAILDNVGYLATVLEEGSDKDKIMHGYEMLLKSLVYCYRIDITNPDGSAFQVTDEKKDVIYRIIKYMYSNYDHKVNLQDISEKEYMSLFYLSHSFKDITGYSFRDWLNFVRVENAEKLLLNSTLSITEIAYQCGFSDVRYFNKHFVKWYKITPNKYRNLFKASYDQYNAGIGNYEKDIPANDIIHRISDITPENDNDTSPLESIIIDAESKSIIERLDPSWKEQLWYNGATASNYREMKQIDVAQREIEFTSITVDEFFTSEIQEEGLPVTRNDHEILNFLLDKFSRVNLVVNCSKNDQYEVNAAIEFLENFFRYNPRGRAAQLEIKLNAADNESETETLLDGFISILNNLNISYEKYESYKKPLDKRKEFENDYIVNMTTGEIRLDWLYSKDGFKNNLYHLYFMLSKMGEAIIMKKDRFLATKKNDGIQVFFHREGTLLNSPESREYRIKVDNLSGNYKIVRYTWNIQRDDISHIVKDPKALKYLTDSEVEQIDKVLTPDITIDHIEIESHSGEGYECIIDPQYAGMELILINKVQ